VKHGAGVADQPRHMPQELVRSARGCARTEIGEVPGRAPERLLGSSRGQVRRRG
jgi:hypothetical protein